MKRFFLASMLVAGLGSVFVSCNNGNYLADPKVAGQNVINPLDPNSGVTIPVDCIYIKVNQGLRKFVNGKWSDSAGFRQFLAYKYNSKHNAEFVGGAINPYTGVGVYPIGDTTAHDIIYGIIDTTNGVISALYAAHTGNGMGNGTINVKGKEDNRIRGLMSGKVYRMNPFVSTDNIELSEGEFYVGKK